MSNFAIQVERLSKRYLLGDRPRRRYQTLRETIVERWSRRASTSSHRPANELWALRDVSFDAPAGQVIGVIGRNGAGKSTLLKLLSRITAPTSGRIKIRGRVGSLLEVGAGFHPELTGRENIYLNGAVLGMRKADVARQFDEIVAFAEIEQHLDTPVKRYSSGMYMRLAFAVAAHMEPDVLVVDEILAVGDARFQKKCLGKISDASGHEGRTVLFVSHNMEAVRRLCQTAILLDGGRVAAAGDVATVVSSYLTDCAAASSSCEFPPPAISPFANVPGFALSAAIEDFAGQPAAWISVGQPWQARVRFRLTRSVEQFRIELGLRTSSEVAARSAWTSPQNLPAGDYEAVFAERSLWLSPGRYTLTVGLMEHERRFDYHDGPAVLEIAEFAAGVALPWLTNVGLVLNPLDARIVPLANRSAA